nr:hypothetical protein CFP56_03109 [Quercus suber]
MRIHYSRGAPGKLPSPFRHIRDHAFQTPSRRRANQGSMASETASADDVEHIADTAVPGQQALDHQRPPKRPNACTHGSSLSPPP